MNLSLRAQNNVTDATQDSLYLFDLHVQQSTTNLVGSLVAASLSDFTGKQGTCFNNSSIVSGGP